MVVTTRSWLVSVLVWTSLVALMSACEAVPEPPAAGSSTSSEPGPRTSATTSARGDAAVWFLKPDQRLQGSSTKFTALVSRLGCSGGVTGQVLAPEIRRTGSEVVVTFTVAPKQSRAATCPGNDQVSFEVDLGEPLQGLALVDGQCLPGGEARTTSFCAPDATRYRP